MIQNFFCKQWKDRKKLKKNKWIKIKIEVFCKQICLKAHTNSNYKKLSKESDPKPPFSMECPPIHLSVWEGYTLFSGLLHLPLICSLLFRVLSKEASSTIFWVFGTAQTGIEPRSPRPLTNTTHYANGPTTYRQRTNTHIHIYSLLWNHWLLSLHFQTITNALSIQTWHHLHVMNVPIWNIPWV